MSARAGVAAVGHFELWMVASITVGVVGFGGLAFLIPNAIVAQGGTAADAGAVPATRGLFMLFGPVVGHLADRFVAHRVVQLGGLLSLGGGAASFAFAREDLTYLLAAFLFGLGLSACLSINLTLVVGAGLSEDETAQKVSVVLQSAVIGLVGLLTTTGVSFRDRFLALAVLAVIGAAITAATTAVPWRACTPIRRQTREPTSHERNGATCFCRSLAWWPPGWSAPVQHSGSCC